VIPKAEEGNVEPDSITQRTYVDKVLAAYRNTPGTSGIIRRQDRILAAQLHQRAVPLPVVENALTLASARRLLRPAGSPPLNTIRSLHYFLGTVDEVLHGDMSQDYFRYLRYKIEGLTHTPKT
jgi:hypothetical protein